jgi:hypothetical protein
MSDLNRWKNLFNQVLNILGVHNVRQMDIHTAEPLVPEPSLVEVETATGNLKRYNKSPGTDQILAKLIKAGGETLCPEIHKIIHSIWKKEELPQQWKESIIVPIHKKGDKTDCNNYRGISLFINCLQNFIQHSSGKVNPIVNEIIGDHQCIFHHNRSITDQIFYICWVLERKKNGSTMGQCISYL